MLVACVLVAAAAARNIVGTARSDVLRGTAKADTIYGKAGNDRLFGLGGNDRLYGGAGADRLYGGPGADRLSCGPGRDIAFASMGDWVLGGIRWAASHPDVDLVIRIHPAEVGLRNHPTRERMALASEDELFDCGFSRRKAEYVVELARNDLDLDGLAALDDDEVRARITAVRGLGPWSAEWFLARHLARPRAWPAGDLVLRKAADVLYGVEVTELGQRLDPFQNLAAQYLLVGLLTGPS